jgi:hypothetical protein
MATVFIMDVRVLMMCGLMMCVIVIASMSPMRMMCVCVCVCMCVLGMNCLCGPPVEERFHQGLEHMFEHKPSAQGDH